MKKEDIKNAKLNGSIRSDKTNQNIEENRKRSGQSRAQSATRYEGGDR